MLDPLTALGLAGNLIQFVDFSSRVVCKARDLNKLTSGSTFEASDAETIAQALVSLNMKIKRAVPCPSTRNEKDLQEVCDGCDVVAKELVEALSRLKIKGGRTKWKSMRQAMKWVLSKEKLDEISKRLANFRDQLTLSFLVTLSDRLDLDAVACAKNFDKLEEATMKSITTILESRDLLDSKLGKQAVRSEELHAAHHRVIGAQHEKLSDEVGQSSDRLANLHNKTLEGQVKAAEDAIDLRRDMMNQFEEIKVLIEATMQAKGACEQRKLKVNTTILTASWLAKQTVYAQILESLESASPEVAADAIVQTHQNSTPGTSPESLSHENSQGSQTHPHHMALRRRKQNCTDSQFDLMIQSLQLLGFAGQLFKLPKSLQFAAANRLSHLQLQKFRSISEEVAGDPRPLFFFGTDLFPASIFQRTINHGMKSLGLVSKLMTVGTLRGYRRYAVYGEAWPAIAPSQGEADKVVGMLVFGLDEPQRQNISNFQDGAMISATVEIVLEDDEKTQLEACIYPWFDSPGLLIPPEEQIWSASRFWCSEYSQWISEKTADSEMALEYGTPNDQAILLRRIREMGFSCTLCKLPTSMLMAIQNRFPRSDIESGRITGHAVRPVFFSGSSMFPANVYRRTPNSTLESIAKLMTPGMVRGYKRYAVKNLDGGALYTTSQEDSEVKGMVAFGLPNQQQAIHSHRDHDFQGGMYIQKQTLAEIELSDGSFMWIDVDIFIWNGSKTELESLDKVRWSPGSFLQSDFYKETANTVQEEEARLAFGRVCHNLESLDISTEKLLS